MSGDDVETGTSDACLRFERLSDGWLMRERDGAFVTRYPISAARVRAYARFFDVAVPGGAETDEDGQGG